MARSCLRRVHVCISPAERVPPAVNAAIPWWHRRRDPLPDVRLGHPTLERAGAWLGPLVDGPLGAADPAPPGTALCLTLFRVQVGAPALVAVNPCLIPPPTAATPGACRPPWPGRVPAATSRSPLSPRPRPPGPTPKPSPSPALLIDHGVGKVPPWSPSDAESIHRKLTAYGELRRDLAGMVQFTSGTPGIGTRGSNGPILSDRPRGRVR